nr:hypothetical protein HK105_003773 [Polyrhizophydium stewartii]
MPQQNLVAAAAAAVAAADAAQLMKLTAAENPFEEVLNSEHPWSVKDIGNNAISGILNEPSAQEKSFLSGPKGLLRGMDTLPVVPPTAIRKVRAAEFDPYLKTLADVIDKHQLNRALGMAATEGIPQLGASSDSLDLASVGLPEFEDLTARVLGAAAGGPKGISKMQRTRMLSANAPPLSSVPSIFLDKDFDLANPHVFSAVCEYMDITGTSSADSAATNKQLQDKLTHYLDTVEVHLLKEISRRSSSFFAALANLQELHSETEECVVKIGGLRKSLSNVSQRTAKSGLEVVRLKRRRGNLGMLYGAVKLLVDIKHTQPMIQILLGHSDYVGALDLIENTSLVLRGIDPGDLAAPGSRPSTNAPAGGSGDSGDRDSRREAVARGLTLVRNRSIVPRNLDLRGVRSLVHLSSQLSELARTVALVMESEFSNTLVSDLRETVRQMIADSLAVAQSSDAQATTAAMTPANPRIRNILLGTFTAPTASTPSSASVPVPKALLSNEERLRTKLTPLVLGLLRMDRLGTALQAFRESLVKELKELTKQYYPPPLADDKAPASSPATPSAIGTATDAQSEADTLLKKKEAQAALTKQLRAMTFDAFYSMLVRVYVASLNTMQRVAIVNELVLSIINDAQTRGIVIGINSVQNMAVASTVTANPAQIDGEGAVPGAQGSAARSAAPGRKMLVDDDDEFGSMAELTEPSGDPFSRSRARSDFGKESGPSGAHAIAASESGLDGGMSTFGQMCNESAEILGTVSDLAHARCAKLIGVRADQNAQLNTTDFYRLFGATWEFVSASEALCGRISFGLKGNLLSQAKAFISHFHDEKSKQIAVLVENEQWVQAEIPIDFQHITEQLQLAKPAGESGNSGAGARQSSTDVSSDGAHSRGASDPATGGDADDVMSRNSDADDDEVDLTSTAFTRSVAAEVRQQQHIQKTAEQAAAPKTLRYLIVDGSKYYVVGSALLFLKTLTDYMTCAESLSVLTTDVLNRILELLKLFNSRVCQVILGAGAMRSAGLKNITARHIALAAQSLGVVIAIIPYVKNGISRLLPPKQQVLLGDFDRILRDFRDHQSELYSKLVSIMNERLVLHSSKLVAISWDNPDPKEISAEESVTVHMAVLVKETTTLHKSIIGEIFRLYVKQLEEDFRKIDLFSSAGKNRLLMDVQYFIQQLSLLEGVDGPGSHLEVCVNNIKIKDRRTMAACAARSGPAGTPSSAASAASAGTGGASTPGMLGVAAPTSAVSPARGAAAAPAGTASSIQGKFAYTFGRAK